MSSPPRKKARDEEENTGMKRRQPDGVIRFEIDNVSTMEENDERISPEVEAKGVMWNAVFFNEGEEANVILKCSNTQSTQWNINVDTEFTIVHTDSSKNFMQKNSETLDKFMKEVELFDKTWDELCEDGFIKDDKVTFEIRFWISSMKGVKNARRVDFFNANEPSHDVALIFNGEKIYVSKQLLSLHSPVFKAMFYGDFAEKNKDEIELKDIDREEFLEMLRVIYPSNKKIDRSSAEYLLKLGDRFQIMALIERVEEFLVSKVSHIRYMDKLQIADKCGLFGLQEHCLSQLTTKKDFERVKDSPIYKDLSFEMKALLFERLLETDK